MKNRSSTIKNSLVLLSALLIVVSDANVMVAEEENQWIASASGYVTDRRNMKIPSSEPVRRDIVLKKGGWITGIVRGTDGSPADRVLVSCYPQPDLDDPELADYATIAVAYIDSLPGLEDVSDLDTAEDETDGDGKFSLRPLQEGTYWLTARGDGYEPYAVLDVAVNDEEETRADIRLTPIAPISGRVVSATGVPLANVELYLEETNDSPEKIDWKDTRSRLLREAKRVYPYAASDENGAFSFTLLNNTGYRLSTQYEIKGKVPLKKTIEGLHPGQRNIEVRFDEPKEKPDLKGKVTDAATGMPIHRFSIVFHNGNDIDLSGQSEHLYDLRRMGKEIVSPSGEFFLEDLPEVPFELVFSAKGYAARLEGPFDTDVPVHDRLIPLEKEGRIAVTINSENASLDTIQTFLTIHENADSSKSGYFCADRPIAMGMHSDVRRNRFMIRNVPSGIYDLVLLSKNRIASATCIQIAAGETLDLGLLRSEPFEWSPQENLYRFRVQNADGKPCPMLRVRLRNGFSSIFLDREISDSRGRFSISWPRLPKSWNRIAAWLGENPMIFSTTTVSPGDNVLVYDKPAGNAAIHGVVLRNNKPVEGIRIMLIPRNDTFDNLPILQEETDGMGRYVMKNIHAGIYDLLIGKPYPLKPEREIQWQEITLGDSEDRFVRTDFRGSNLTGRVMNRNGEPMSGAYVQVGFSLQLSERQLNAIGDYTRRSVKADSYGAFTFNNLQAGEYELWASRYSHGVSEKQRIVVEDKNIDGTKIHLQ